MDVIVYFASTYARTHARTHAGKVREALARGEPVKDGVLLDKHGQPTNDTRCLPPHDGALLPFAGHKGYALALMCELIGAAITGGYTIEPAHPRHADIIVNSMTSLVRCRKPTVSLHTVAPVSRVRSH